MKERGRQLRAHVIPPSPESRAQRARQPRDADTEGLRKSEVSNQEEKSSCASRGCGLLLGVPSGLLFPPEHL